MFNAFRKNLSKLISPTKNSMSLPNQFLKYGNEKPMTSNWSEILMRDKDLYTGYAYAAIRNRAVMTARIAADQVRTDSTDTNQDFIHPYCKLIWDSPTFSEFDFWSQISTFLDLEGVYYLLAIRNFKGDRFGDVQQFKLLNPYHIRRVLNENSLEVGGYIETRKGFTREIPPEQIIEIRELNPFDEDLPYAMTDAAKEAQFTLKTSGEYTRSALRNNINAPGILSTDVVLEDDKFQNFKARIVKHTKGEPIFGNGTGAIKWDPMDVDLSKSASKDINEMNRDMLLSTLGLSKTIMGIEQSGTTRETAKVQRDLMIENQIIPRIQLIIDSLNRDYRNRYPQDYKKNEAYIVVDNPQETDYAANLTASQVQKANFELYQSMLQSGYTPKKASAFVEGEIEIDGLGKPKETTPVTPPPTTTEPPATQKIKKKVNAASLSDEVQHQQALLKNEVIHIDRQLVSMAIARIDKNDYNQETDLITKKQKKELINELDLVLAGFYAAIFQSRGPEVIDQRGAKFDLTAHFSIDKVAQNYIKQVSEKVAESHITTVTQEILQTAQDAALEGLSQKEIVSRIKQNFADEISTVRAETVARTETNRAFTQAQYEADRQFIQQNELEGRAYKRWKTRSENPCAFCKSLEDEGLIPFSLNFRDLGDEVKVGSGDDKKTLNISFESLQAGNAHPNCSCIYELVIK